MSSLTMPIDLTEANHIHHTRTTTNNQWQSESLVPPAVLARSFPNANEAPQYAPVPLATQQAQWQDELAAGRPLRPVVGRNYPSSPLVSTSQFPFPGSGRLERMEQGSLVAADWASAVVGSPMEYRGQWPPAQSNASYAPTADRQRVPNVVYGQQESPQTATASGMPNVRLFPSATHNVWVSNRDTGAQNASAVSVPQSSMSRYPVVASQEAAKQQSPTENRSPLSEFGFAFPAGTNGPAAGPAQQLGPNPSSTQQTPFVGLVNEVGTVDQSLPWWPNDANGERSDTLNMQDNIFAPIFAPENEIQDWFSGLENDVFLGSGADAPAAVPTSFGGMEGVARSKENEGFEAHATWPAYPQPKSFRALDDAKASAVLAEVANTMNPLKRKRSVADDEGTAKKQRASKNVNAGAGKWQQWYCKVEDPSSRPRYRCLVPGCADAASGNTYALDRGVRRHLTNKHGEMAYKPRVEAA